jgi:hypothetical protein
MPTIALSYCVSLTSQLYNVAPLKYYEWSGQHRVWYSSPDYPQLMDWKSTNLLLPQQGRHPHNT